jgi:hypothetical protein
VVYSCPWTWRRLTGDLAHPWQGHANGFEHGADTAGSGGKPVLNLAIFEARRGSIERVFAQEDKFRRLLLRFDRLGHLHYAFNTLVYNVDAMPIRLKCP